MRHRADYPRGRGSGTIDGVNRSAGAWSGYAAAVLSFVFAVPSFYWGFGGKFGGATVFADADTWSWSKDWAFLLLVLFTAVLKVFGGLFALSLVRPSMPRASRRWMLVAGFGAAVVLAFYGFVNVLGEVLVATGVVGKPSNYDAYSFHWHLFLWDPYFLVWGILLGLAVRYYRESSS
jgi:Protein of unknown function (DUF3995)